MIMPINIKKTTVLYMKLLFLVSILFYLQYVRATDFRYSADYEYAYYENINNVLAPVSNEYSNALVGRFSVLENSGYLNASVNGQLRTTQYKNNITSDRTRARVSVLSTWVLRPKSVEWFLSDVFTQTTINSLISDTPDNRQNINTFSTGPDFSIKLNSLNRIIIKPRIESYLFQVGNDNVRIKNDLEWEYSINSTITMQLNQVLEKVDFQKDNLNPDRTRNDLFVSLISVKALNRLQLDLGRTRVNDDFGRNFDNPRFKLSISSQRNHNTLFNLSYGVRITDVGRYIAAQNAPVSSLDNASLSLFQNTTSRLGIVRQISSGSLSLTYSNLLREFEVTPELNQQQSNLALSGKLALTGLSKLYFSLYKSKKDFLNDIDGRIYNDSSYSIKYAYTIRRNLFFNMNVSTRERSSNIAEAEYKSPKIILSIQYSSF